MYKSLALAICLLANTAFAVDVLGTWKLNTAKSKYTGMPAPKEMTVVYAPEGSGWRYSGKGVSATGAPVTSSFTFVKEGEDIKTTGFPNWDTIVLSNTKAAKANAVIKRQGKPVGKMTRTVSADEKTMTIAGELTGLDGKPVSFVSVYERQ